MEINTKRSNLYVGIMIDGSPHQINLPEWLERYTPAHFSSCDDALLQMENDYDEDILTAFPDAEITPDLVDAICDNTAYIQERIEVIWDGI